MAGRRSSNVIASPSAAAIWKSAAFGGSPPRTPPSIQPSMRSSQPGKAARSASTASSVTSLIAQLGGDDGRGRRDGHPVRDADLRAVEVGAKRRAVALDRVPEDPPDSVLEDLVAPALRVLDLDALRRVGGEERRVGLDLVERLRDLARARDPPAVDPERRDGDAREAHDLEDAAADHGHEVAALVVDPLVLEHAPRRHGGMGAGNHVQGGAGHAAASYGVRPLILRRCFSRSTSATPRRTSAPSRARTCGRAGAFRPARA